MKFSWCVEDDDEARTQLNDKKYQTEEKRKSINKETFFHRFVFFRSPLPSLESVELS